MNAIDNDPFDRRDPRVPAHARADDDALDATLDDARDDARDEAIDGAAA